MTFTNQAQEMHAATMASAYAIPLAKRQRLADLLDDAIANGGNFEQFWEEAKRPCSDQDSTNASPPPEPEEDSFMAGINANRQAQREEMAVCMVEGRTTPDNRRTFMGALEQYGPALSDSDWAVLLFHLLNYAFRGDAQRGTYALSDDDTVLRPTQQPPAAEPLPPERMPQTPEELRAFIVDTAAANISHGLKIAKAIYLIPR